MKQAFVKSGMEHIACGSHVYYGLKLRNLEAMPVHQNIARLDPNCGFGGFSAVGHTGVSVRNCLVVSIHKLMDVRA